MSFLKSSYGVMWIVISLYLVLGIVTVKQQSRYETLEKKYAEIARDHQALLDSLAVNCTSPTPRRSPSNLASR
mgnify:CR=1 FL=1